MDETGHGGDRFAVGCQGVSKARALVVQTLRHWKEDVDLAGIRDEAAVRALPQNEQKTCRALWAEVDAALRKTQGP